MSTSSGCCRRAFTLVELLVVIGIIAILIAVLLPVISMARQQAKAAQCVSNVRQIATAALMYAQERKFYVSFVAASGSQPARDRKELLFPYIQHGANNKDTAGSQVWTCPANDQVDLEASYGFNTNLNGKRLEAVKNPTETVALCDAGVPDQPAPDVALATHCWPPGRPSTDKSCRPNHLRHPKQTVGVGFVDGHAERLPMRKPFYPGPVGVYVPPMTQITNEFDPAYVDQLWDLQ